MRIREAEDRDWESIYDFFGEIVAEGRTIAYPESLTSGDARAMWFAAPPSRTVVAVRGDTVAGSATMGPNRPGRGSHVATATFMVAPSQRGHGVGRALGVHVLDWARSAGYHGIQFNAVVETNVAAVHLWQDLGFRIIGTVPAAFDHRDHGLVGMHVMYQELATGSR